MSLPTFPAAAFLAPALGGLSLQTFGSLHWLIVAAVGVLAAVLHLAAGPSRERRVAQMKAPAAAGDTHPHRRRPH